MRVETLLLGMGATNCYIVFNEETKQALIVDPAAEPGKIVQEIKKNELTPCAILLTHGHADHIGAVAALREMYQISAYCHEDEKQVLENTAYNLTGSFGQAFTITPDILLEDGQELELGEMKFKVIHTPGHTAGGACYYFEDDQILFSGDTLFSRSIGRTDLPTGNTLRLLTSVKEKLMVLDEQTVVYPGHMEATKIKREKRDNLYLR